MKKKIFYLLLVSIISVLMFGYRECRNDRFQGTEKLVKDSIKIEAYSKLEEKLEENQEEKNTNRSWETELIGHSFGRIDGYIYTGCLEAFQEKYNAGIRTFEVDFSTASDGKIVLRHDWNMRLQEGISTDYIPSSEEFKYIKIYGKYTPLTFIDLLQLMKEYPDIWIVTDSKASQYEEVQAEFREMYREVEESGMTNMLNRMIIQIYNEEMYDAVREIYAFSNYIFTLYMRWSGDLVDFENICRWCVMHDVKYITMWNYLYNEQIRMLADKYNIAIFVHTENDAMAGINYLKSGVKGIYTDDITEDMLVNYADLVKVVYFSGINYNAMDYVWGELSTQIENGGVWTEGEELYFWIPVESEDSSFNLRVEVIVNDIYNNSQRYEVIQNNILILNGTLTSGEIISFSASVENGFCKFRIKFPDAISEYKQNEAADKRCLALQLEQVLLYRENLSDKELNVKSEILREEEDITLDFVNFTQENIEINVDEKGERMMELLFILIAVCPAMYMVFMEKKQEPSLSIWESITQFAEWFYEITFLNLILLYLRGWKEFAFERLSVQFLMKYMISSVVWTVILAYGKPLIKLWRKNFMNNKKKLNKKHKEL